MYKETDYEQVVGSRADEEWSAFLSANYKVLDDNFIIGGKLAYTDNSSDSVSADYDVLEATLSCSVLF